MDKNNHSSAPMGIKLNMDVRNSKLIPAILFKNELPFEEVEEVLLDLIDKIGTINRLDLPLYIAAFKLLQATLSTNLDEAEEELIDLLMSHSTLTTYQHISKDNHQKGGNKDADV